MIKAYEITPSADSRFDSTVVRDDGTWKPALDAIEQSLENQFLLMDDNNTEWKDITVTVKCIEMTEEQFKEIEEASHD